jgi:predicted RNase H-like HicB family nuclease
MREPEYKYAIEIFWSEEDGCFVACVPDLENCAACGMSYEEALAQARAAIRADLDSRRVLGEPVPKPTPRYLPVQAID